MFLAEPLWESLVLEVTNCCGTSLPEISVVAAGLVRRVHMGQTVKTATTSSSSLKVLKRHFVAVVVSIWLALLLLLTQD